MYKQAFNAVFVLNVIFQSIFTLLFDTGLFVLIAYLLNSYAGAERWMYIPFVLFGLGLGIFSMMKLIMSAMKSLERLEDEQKCKNEKTVKEESSDE